MAPSVEAEPVSSYDRNKDTYRGPSKVKFDPAIHLNYTPPERVYSLSELGLPLEGTSDFATTEPFQLATEAAIVELRRELLQPNTLKKRMHTWPRAPASLRGFTKEEAPFTHAFWTSPEVIKILSDAAGIEMEVALPYEIGHTNVQLGPEGREGLKNLPLYPVPVPPGWEEEKGDYDHLPVDNWHKDSFAYSCVMMLSNTEKMVGGETAIQLPDGTTRKLRGTKMGSCIFLQGRHMPHAALRAWNTGERITMVCPYRPAHPAIRDDTEITNSLQQSYLNELYGQFSLERFKVIRKKCDYMIKRLEDQKREALEREPDNYNAVIMDEKEVGNMMREMVWYLETAMKQMGMYKDDK